MSDADFDSIYDCIIVGGGPAGLTGAIFLARYQRRVLVCDNGRPRNRASRAIHGFLGQHGIDPRELLERGRAEARESGASLCECTVETIEKNGDEFQVTTSAGTMRARRILLAYGVRDELPDIPGIDAFYGVSLFHCPDCDGFESRNKKIGVIASGRKAVGLSLKMLQWSCEVTIFCNGEPREFDDEETSKLFAEGIAIKDEKIVSLTGDHGQVEAAVLSTGERVPVDVLFFSIAVERSCDLAEALGCEVHADAPCIVVDEHRETMIRGIYAAGDLVPGAQLAITSAADGAIAAIAINKSLLPPGRVV